MPPALPTSGRTPRSHALQPSFLHRPKGARQEAGEPRPPSLSPTAPNSPEHSALEPESKGEIIPRAPPALVPGLRRSCWHYPPLPPGTCASEPCLPSRSHLHPRECISTPRGLQSVTSLRLTISVCLSVHPTPRPAKNKAVPQVPHLCWCTGSWLVRGAVAPWERRPDALQRWPGMQVGSLGPHNWLAAGAWECPPPGSDTLWRQNLASHLHPSSQISPALLSLLPRVFLPSSSCCLRLPALPESPAAPTQPLRSGWLPEPETHLISIIKCIHLPNEPGSTTGV